MLITTTDALIEFCDALRGAPYIAVDTEFLRDKTYYAGLCLVQVAHGEHAAAIDPLADGIDMAPLAALLRDENIVKVLHSATQDLEIFLAKLGGVPGPVFDTQIAASVCGLGTQPGYATLVEAVVGIKIDKGPQATDWSLRPLTDRQLAYAISDVTHLCDIYEHLQAELTRTGRGAWVEEEMQALLDPNRYRTDPREAWRRVRLRRPSRRTVGVLRELAAWREETAMQRNTPRGWVVRDEALAEIASSQPDSVDALARVRKLPAAVAKGRDGEAMLEAVKRGMAVPEDELPRPKARSPRVEGHEPVVALLGALLQLKCAEHGVAADLIARSADLVRIATEDEPDVPALSGWRRRLFGEAAVALCAGELALTVQDGAVVPTAR